MRVFRLGEKQTFSQLKLRAMLVKNKLSEKRRSENIERKIDLLEKKMDDLKAKK